MGATSLLAGVAVTIASLSMAPLAYANAPIVSPGPSLALFKKPYYACKTNYYVAPTGSDINSGTSETTPWLTLQHANNAMPSGGAAAGSCINVAPGTYAGVTMTVGGNLAASSGYLVYRCSTMDACIVNSTAGVNRNAGFFAAGTGAANYVIIDGFDIAGNGTTWDIGVEIVGSSSGGVGTFGSHHDWVMNSIIHGHGQGGIGFANGDYTYAIHNRIFHNAMAPNCDSGAQGSGLADNVPLDIQYQYPNYAPTADDKTNPNPLIGSFVTGSSWFHKAYMYNVVHNNYISPCNGSTTSDTDGNNIILDTFSTGNGNKESYPDQTLIAYNVAFNSGGGGIHIFFSEYATVANNTVYNAYLDPDNQAADRAGIDTTNSYGNTIINNVIVAVPMAPDGKCSFGATPFPQFNSATLGGPPTNAPADVWSNNITELQGGNGSCWGDFGQDAPTGENPMFQADAFSCTSNKCSTNPLWVAVSKTSTGSMTRRPSDINFALQPSSPAIGYGLKETYLPATSVDAGACARELKTCP